MEHTTRLIAASALWLSALAATAQTAKPLKIGVIGPFTGPSSDFGVQILQGLLLAAELPLIIPCATGSPLTAKYPAPESYIFRTSARDAIQAP